MTLPATLEPAPTLVPAEPLPPRLALALVDMLRRAEHVLHLVQIALVAQLITQYRAM